MLQGEGSVWFCSDLVGRHIFRFSRPHCACIIQARERVHLLLICCPVSCGVWKAVYRLSCLDSAEQLRGEAELLVVPRWVSFFFPSFLLGSLAQAGLPPGFRAIYRHSSIYMVVAEQGETGGFHRHDTRTQPLTPSLSSQRFEADKERASSGVCPCITQSSQCDAELEARPWYFNLLCLTTLNQSEAAFTPAPRQMSEWDQQDHPSKTPSVSGLITWNRKDTVINPYSWPIDLSCRMRNTNGGLSNQILTITSSFLLCFFCGVTLKQKAVTLFFHYLSDPST